MRGRVIGPAAVRVTRNGMLSLSSRALDLIGRAPEVLIAARDGELLIKVAQPGDHRAYRVYITRGSGCIRAHPAAKAAGLLPDDASSVRYMAIECQADDGRQALYVHRAQMIPLEKYTRKNREVAA